MTTQIIKAKFQHKPEYGDVLLGADYLCRKPLVDLVGFRHVVPLTLFHANPFAALTRMDISIEHFAKEVQYVCPYTEHVCYWIVPMAILTQDRRALQKRLAQLKTVEQFTLDYAFNCSHKLPTTLNDPISVVSALLGPGYTAFTRKSDGSRSTQFGYVELDSGDHLYVVYYLWYNK